MAKHNFNSVVAARTRAAEQILSTPELLSKYVAAGGLLRDLETIRRAGLEAEAANLAQSQSHSSGKSATVDILASFASLQKEYSAVMAVVSAVAAELVRNGGDSDLITKLNDILVNEAQLSVKVTSDEGGEKKRTARRSVSQEALRAEITKDAGALLALEAVHPALAERLVTKERLAAMKSAGEGLAGLLADRAAAKGAGKEATQAESEAAALQRDVWGASYRILAALGAQDARVQSLLSEAADRP